MRSSESQRSFTVFGIALAFALGFFLGWFYANFLGRYPAAEDRDLPLDDAGARTSVRRLEPSTNETALIPRVTRKTPQTAKAVLDRLLADLEHIDPSQSDTFPIMGRLQQLKDFGEDGSRVIQDYLRTQQDVILPSGRFQTLTGEPVASLRTALIASLNGVGDSTAQAVNLDVLRTSSISTEVGWAARNLETLSPGMYRSEILKAVGEMLRNTPAPHVSPEGYMGASLDPQLFDLVVHFQATEMTGDVCEALRRDPRLVPEWFRRVSVLPPDIQLSSIRTLLNDERGKTALASCSALLVRLDLQGNDARQLIRFVFQNEMSLTQREAFLQQIGQTLPADGSGQVSRGPYEAQWKLLNEIDPQLAPALRVTSQGARKRLQDKLKSIR